MPARVWVFSAPSLASASSRSFRLTAVPDSGRPHRARSGCVRAWAVAEAPPEPAGPSPELMAAVAATASARQSVLPATHVPVPGGPTVLTLVTAAENQLTFAYEVEIDLAEYVLPADPTSSSRASMHTPARPTRRGSATISPRPSRPCLRRSGAPGPPRSRRDRPGPLRDINRRPLADTAVLVAACV